MGRDITKRHSALFEKRLRSGFSFLRDIYQYGKARELSSFLVWELRHRLGLFPANQYLSFLNDDAMALDGAAVGDEAFAERLGRFLQREELSASPCAADWKVLFLNNGELYGSLARDDRSLFRSNGRERPLGPLHTFPERIKSIFVTSRQALFVCVPGAVYRSADRGGSFHKCLTLGSSASFFRHNNGMTETPDKTLVLGEYGNVWDDTRWRQLAYVYFSTDDGVSWERSDFLIRQGTNKHVHLVKYSKLLSQLFVADGDNKKKLWMSAGLDSPDLEALKTWTPVNRFHIQMGGYTSVVETDDQVLFGSDYQGGTNFLVSTRDGRTYDKRVVPDPYRRSPIDNMVQRQSKRGTEIWANLPYSTAGSKCLLMVTVDGGNHWRKVIEYHRATHKVWLISSSTGIPDRLYLSVEDLRNGDRAVYEIHD
ncbi:MAG: exo-alpha-sialidase [Pirellulales bacterium]|nr:exo-alpha-sialidase [Pirellulales bacterium]